MVYDVIWIRMYIKYICMYRYIRKDNLYIHNLYTYMHVCKCKYI